MGNKDLIRYMDGREIVEREEIIARFAGEYKVPPYEKLARSYIAANISQGLAAVRDGEGRRLILAKRGKDGVHYVHITACKEQSVLTHIRNRIEHDIIGQYASLEQVDLRIGTLDSLKLDSVAENYIGGNQ